MATSTTTVTVTDTWYDGQRQHIIGTLIVNAGDYAAGGLVVDFSKFKIKSTKVPLVSAVQMWGIGGFIYAYVAGATLALGKMMVFAETTVATNQPLLEYTNTAASAGLLADVIRFHLIVKALR